MIFAPWISYIYFVFVRTHSSPIAMMGPCWCTHLIIFFGAGLHAGRENLPRQLCKFLTIDCRTKQQQQKNAHDGEIFMVMIWWAFELTARQLNSKVSQNFEDRWIFERGPTTTTTKQQSKLTHKHTHKSILQTVFSRVMVGKKRTSEFFMTNERETKKIHFHCQKKEKKKRKTRKFLKLLTKNEILERPKE